MSIEIIVALLAIVVGALALFSAAGARGRVTSLESEMQRRKSEMIALQEELDRKLHNAGLLIERASEGRKVRSEQILEGRLWNEIDGATARQLCEESPGTLLVDVREQHEYQAAHIPGARLIPLNELASRLAEIPKDADHVIIHCASGNRSASACALLSETEGYLNLHNLTGGIAAWPGKIQSGVPEKVQGGHR